MILSRLFHQLKGEWHLSKKQTASFSLIASNLAPPQAMLVTVILEVYYGLDLVPYTAVTLVLISRTPSKHTPLSPFPFRAVRWIGRSSVSRSPVHFSLLNSFRIQWKEL
mmetsp:Transcript_23950/g.39996  ORF Transcript_23950/g.39996 Transcript_23950/m.39996 type:complete len:109 (+) Transcript_23950:1058-1384(+)